LNLLVELLEPEPRAIFDVELEPAHGPDPLHGRRRKDRDERILNRSELLVELADDAAGIEPGLPRPFAAPFYPVTPLAALLLSVLSLGVIVYFNLLISVIFAAGFAGA